MKVHSLPVGILLTPNIGRIKRKENQFISLNWKTSHDFYFQKQLIGKVKTPSRINKKIRFRDEQTGPILFSSTVHVQINLHSLNHKLKVAFHWKSIICSKMKICINFSWNPWLPVCLQAWNNQLKIRLLLKQNIAMVPVDNLTMWFIPNALNAKVNKFN